MPSRRLPLPPSPSSPRLRTALLPPPLLPPSLLLLLLLLLLIAAPSCSAADAPQLWAVEGKIETNDEMPVIPRTMRVTLDGGLYTGYVRVNGDFAIHRVPSGSYLLEILTGNYTFNRYRVDVGAEGGKAGVNAYQVPAAVEWDVKGPAVPYPLRIAAQRKNKFFHDREGFNIVGMFANPMMLMMLFSVGLMFLGPKLMENMDPQALEEVKRSSAGTNPQASLPDLSQTLANMLAPKTPSGAAASGSSSSSSSASSSSPGKSRRR